ncbi:MAG: hypothetical protein IJQ11_00065, partial [Bacteroidales bacterium]|nr:hypothetical protein [Bacteroidales bacterium]
LAFFAWFRFLFAIVIDSFSHGYQSLFRAKRKVQAFLSHSRGASVNPAIIFSPAHTYTVRALTLKMMSEP